MRSDLTPYGSSEVLPPRQSRILKAFAFLVVGLGSAYVVLTVGALAAREVYDHSPSEFEAVDWLGSPSLSKFLMVSSVLGAFLLAPLAGSIAIKYRPRVTLIIIALASFILWPVAWHLRWYDALGMAV